MNDKVNIPEELAPGKYYSFQTELKVNGWCWVAIAASFVNELVLLPHHKDLPVATRAALALVPWVAGLHLLVEAGVLAAKFQAQAGFVVIWLVVCFYILGQEIFKRRYK